MDDTTAQLLKITGRTEEWGELFEAVLDIGTALDAAYRGALQEKLEARKDPANASTVKCDRYFTLLELTAKFAVDRNIDFSFLSQAGVYVPLDHVQDLAAAIGNARGINYAWILAAFYGKVAKMLDRAEQDEQGEQDE